MSYKVNFDALDSLCTELSNQSNNWQAELENLQAKVQTLMGTANMSGAAADNIKCYMETVHNTLIGLLSQLISLHSSNFWIYKNDYHTNIDTSLHTVIDSSEIINYKSRLTSQKKTLNTIHEEVNYALQKIKDIYYAGYSDIYWADYSHISAIDFLTDLDEKITNLELNHSVKDFESSSEMIESLKAFISEQSKQSRSYKSDFTMEKLASSETFRKLYQSHVDVTKELDEKAESIKTAIENEQQRVADIQKEYEERQEKAKIINWVVTGVCIVGSIAAIVATGGAATPLVVGVISAASGAVIAGTNNLTSQYVEHGNLIDNAEDVDWMDFGKDVVVAGVAGFVTGYVGSSIGGAITSKLGATKVGGSLLHSTNAVTRIGTGAAIGGISEVSAGVVSRAAGTFISTGGDLGEAVDVAFDGKQILLDATLGGASGGVEQVSAIGKAQKAADDAAAAYNKKYNPLEAGESKGLKNLKGTKNGGVDFSDSDQILRTESGNPIQVKIKSTGNRKKDYKLAEQILKEEYGIDMDLKSMRTGQNKTHVWHHVDDYNVMTNETTMQFIDIDAHKAIENHSGSANQYHVAHGTGYGKQQIDVKYEGIKILDYMDPVIENTAETYKNLNSIDNKVDNLIYSPNFG